MKGKQDIVIYEAKTSRAYKIVSHALHKSIGEHTLAKHLATIAAQLSEEYLATTVDAGTVRVGDTLPARLIRKA